MKPKRKFITFFFEKYRITLEIYKKQSKAIN